jgi:glycosyltransferase involved in cell wall biosynthesis
VSRPLVTVGITAWNAADTIERAVRSALAQDWRPIEIVVVDDASSDDTAAILMCLAAGNQEVRIFTQPVNGGVGVARNRVLAEAHGEFVAFFDDDDESLPERVSAQLTRILDYEREFAGGAPVVCHTTRRRVYPNGLARIEPTMGQLAGRRAPHGLAVARRILAGTPLEDGDGACPACTQMARRSTYELIGGFDPAFRRSEDTDLCVRLGRAGAHFVGLGRPLVIQTMKATLDKSLAGEAFFAISLIDKHRDLFESEPDYLFARNWVALKHHWLANRRLRFAAGLARLGLTRPAGTGQRLLGALPNLGLNRAFRRFHAGPKT